MRLPGGLVIVDLARLNHIFRNSLPCVQPHRVGHKRYPVGDSKGGREAAATLQLPRGGCHLSAGSPHWYETVAGLRSTHAPCIFLQLLHLLCQVCMLMTNAGLTTSYCRTLILLRSRSETISTFMGFIPPLWGSNLFLLSGNSEISEF